MTSRRRLLCILLAGASSVAALAQPAVPTNVAVEENPNLRFANGVVAQAEDTIITVADVMQTVGPLVPQIRQSTRNEKEFQEELERVQDTVIQDLIDKVLIVKEFRKDEKRQIPQNYIDQEIESEIADRFEGDRSKFLAYLRQRGKTQRDYRKEKEEEIIYGYMQQQQRKSQSVVSPVKIETYYNENKDRFYREDAVHLRMIQLIRQDGMSDESLRQKAAEIIAKHKAGENFAELAKQYSEGPNRSKGGDWGWMQRSDFAEAFSEPALRLKKGEVSEPIVLPDAAYILYAEDRKYAGIQPIDEVRDIIERQLVQQMGRTNQERWLERLRRNGYVKHY